jgi:hypothetical protein
VSASRRFRRNWLPAVLIFLLGAALGLAVAVKWRAFLSASNVGDFIIVFVTSSGFGGFATIVAASIAVFGVRRQVLASLKTSRRERKRLGIQAKDAEWWKSFEWATSKSFAAAGGQAAAFDDDLSYRVALGLQDRARTVEQEKTCDALVDQIASRRNANKSAQSATDAGRISSSSLASYLQAAELRERGPLQGAKSRLLELRVAEVLSELANEGVIDDAVLDSALKPSLDGHISRADVLIDAKGQELVVELKSLETVNAESVRRSISQARRTAAGRPALVLISTPNPPSVELLLSWTTSEMVKVAVLGDVVDLEPAELRRTLSEWLASRHLG